MYSKEMTIDNNKIEVAFARLQANPEKLTPVEAALNDFFENLNLNLNEQEKLTFLRGVFTTQGESYFVSRDLPQDLNCTPSLISYQCTGCKYREPASDC